jgi:hypothetical protein
MNKVILSTVMACGLLLLDAPEAAAHEQRESQYRATPYQSHGRDSYSRDGYRKGYRDGYRRDHKYDRRYDNRRGYYGSHYRRTNDMPRWLKRNKSFRHWMRHSGLRENRRLSWNQLFDIYRWEHDNYRYDRY